MGRETKPARTDRPSRGRADLRRLRGMTEGQIEGTSPPELVDLPDDFRDGAVVVASAASLNPGNPQTRR